MSLPESLQRALGVSGDESPEVLCVLLQEWIRSGHPEAVPILADQILRVYPACRHAVQLFHKGYVVIPVLDAKAVSIWRSELQAAIRSFPEYTTGASVLVLGGFAALGNAASFHHPAIRKKRGFVYDHVRATILRDYAIIMGQEEDLKSELLFDRIMWRQKGQAPSRESWHRDVCVGAPQSTLQEGDNIFGGWLNLDDTEQYFSCVPGTHHDFQLHDLQTRGFATISKEQHDECRRRATMVTIPAGHALVFFQHLVHEVLPTKAKQDMYRMFHGFRVTTTNRPLFVQDYTTRGVFRDHALPRLPSFQLPPMYSANHGSAFLGITTHDDGTVYYKDKFHPAPGHAMSNLIDWSAGTFRPHLLETKRHGKTGRAYQIVRRFMRSLREDGFGEMYPVYTDMEQALYVPAQLVGPEWWEESKTP